MYKSKRKAFTLIELIAVLVIMAIIALIVTPLVMSIIRKARISADKRSIDAYGRSIELAIAGYLLDTGSFPTSVDQLTIEYSGNEVVCTTTQLNTDSSVYLDGCTVDGRAVDYEYRTLRRTPPAPTYAAYQVGDHVSYNGVAYYVIEDSDATNDTVKLLKEEPLTKTEMDNLNLAGITITEINGYGTVQYGSSTDYSTSTVKQVVDAWKNSAVKAGDSAIARLITWNDLFDNLGYESWNENTTRLIPGTTTQNWLYSNTYYYWTMSQADDSQILWIVFSDGSLFLSNPPFNNVMVRPVLELNKSAEITKID